MTKKEFIKMLMTDLLNFDINMETLNFTVSLSSREWMEMFLQWSEWDTDMKDEYWKE